jgi:hypothetical protein
MAIAETDLIFLESERLDDSDQGGGRMTGNVIPDGQENNLFADIGPGARVTGRVFLREAFAANHSNDTDVYLDAHLALIETPSDPAVSVTLFSTGEAAAIRADARDYIERYLTRSGYWPGQLYGNHLAGQRALQIVALIGVESPNVGQTLVLIQDEGTLAEIEQYARITRVEAETREFVDDRGSFFRQIILAELSDVLRYDFAGVDPTRYASTGGRTKLRDTIAAAAARYYSARPLVAPAAPTDRTVYVDSLYAQLVPAAQTETPLVDLNAASGAAPLVVCGNALTLTTSAPLTPTTALYLNAGIAQGSLIIVTGGTILTDDGHGQLESGLVVVATIDYTQGTVVGVAGGPSYTASKTCTWTPVGAVGTSTLSAAIAVTAGSRSLNVIFTLAPIPRPGVLRVDYLVGGKWYRLQDRGDGALVGASSAHGAGSFNFTTGSALVTLGALPDIGSAILIFWANAPDATERGGAALAPPRFLTTLAHPNLVAGTLTLDWTVGGVTRSASAGATGILSGDATGTINITTGALVMVPALLPAPGTLVRAGYQYGPPRETVFSAPLREPDGSLLLALPDANLLPGSVEIVWNLLIEDYDAISNTPAELQIRPRIDPYKTIRDDGAGVLVIPGGANGTVDYAAGTVSFLPDVTVSIPWPRYRVQPLGFSADGRAVFRNTFVGFEYKPAGASMPYDETGRATVRYRVAGGVGSVADEALPVAALVLDATKDYAEAVVADSLRLRCGGRTYADRNGVLYYGLDPATGAGTPGGSLQLGSGRAILTDWASNVAPDQALDTLLTQLNAAITDETVFRIAIAPVRPGSLSIRATPLLDGASAINLTANIDGTIYQAGVADGTVDYLTGVTRVRWGGWVNDADVTPEQKLEIWYSADARVEIGGVLKIFKPRPVYADTIKYNAVGYSYLPLSADLIGIDPVRLPSDGRVPCLQKGDVILLTHSTVHSVQSPVAGGTVDTELTAVARVRVYDAEGDAVPPSRYHLAQDTGIATWANPLDLAGYTAPYAVKAWIEDAAMIVDADLSGMLTLNLALAHAYPAGALVSSALMKGDLYASVGALFAQQAWTSVWSDERIGSPILAQYNDLLYPIELTNAASWRERWLFLFASSTSFRVIGETLGDITDALGGAGFHDIDHACAPVNPLTNTPYFVLPWEGWGSGWVAGNCLRLNLTAPANFPFWIAMTVQPSQPAAGPDQFRLLLRGGIDA